MWKTNVRLPRGQFWPNNSAQAPLSQQLIRAIKTEHLNNTVNKSDLIHIYRKLLSKE